MASCITSEESEPSTAPIGIRETYWGYVIRSEITETGMLFLAGRAARFVQVAGFAAVAWVFSFRTGDAGGAGSTVPVAMAGPKQ